MSTALPPQFAALMSGTGAPTPTGGLPPKFAALMPASGGAAPATGLPPKFAALMPAATSATAKPSGGGLWGYVKGADSPLALPETALALGSGAAGQIVGGLAGLGDAGARLFDKSLPQPANVVQSVEHGMTYQPRTTMGRAVTSAIGYPFQKLAQGADWAGQKVSNLTGSPALGATVNTAIQALPMALGAKLPELDSGAAEARPEVPAPVTQARELGLKLTPTEAQVPGGAVGRTLESLTNHAKLERAISRSNAGRVTALAARDVGINGPVTPDSISAAYEPHYAVYHELKQLGTVPTDEEYARTLAAQRAPGADSFPNAKKPDVEALREAYAVPQFAAKDAVAQIRELRKEGNAEAYGKYDPAKNALGHSKLNIARALEDQIERHLQGTESADLVGRFRGARQGIAKLTDFERAWRAGNEENVSARALGKRLQKGAPLSGDMRKIAETANKFPRAFQDVSKLRNTGPLSNLDFKLEGGLGAIKGLAALKALPFFWASPAARALLGSDLYQRAAFGPSSEAAAASFPALLRGGRALPLIAGGQQQAALPLSQLLRGALPVR